MTVIVWDGTTLATDGAASDEHNLWPADKAWDCGSFILAGVGAVQTILEMKRWYLEGADEKKFPEVQRSAHWCHFLVVDAGGLRRYEQGAMPIEHGRSKCAFGEGKDFAYGALAMGADAATAVRIANDYSAHCGLGVKTYKIGE